MNQPQLLSITPIRVKVPGSGRKPGTSPHPIKQVEADSEANAWEYTKLLRRYNVSTPWQLIQALNREVFELKQLREVVKPGTETFLKDQA